jgi:4-amino-4-deoxy-L-arabinose transferase-like glycosyltransferase
MTSTPLHPTSAASPAAAPAPSAALSAWAWWLTGALAVAWLVTLGWRHLVPSDEGRYAQMALEMFASGDWVTPRYQGVLYFEKPPLHLWATVVAYHLFGVGEWQARLWCGLSALLATAALGLACARWHGPRAGWLAALILLACPTWVLAGHFNSLDMGVSAMLGLVLAAFLLAEHPQASAAARRGWMAAAWAAMGLAVLSKGLIGVVLPGLALVTYSLIARDLGPWRRLQPLVGLPVLLLVTVPWFVAVERANPGFSQFFFIHEHFARYTSEVHKRSAPWWYFLPQVAAGFLPWLGAGWAIVRLVRGSAGGAGDSAVAARDRVRPDLLCAAWAMSILVFFSLSGSKLPGYVVPMFPALAWLAARVLDRADAAAWRRLRRWMLLALALAALGVGAFSLKTAQPGLQAYAQGLLVAMALAAASVALAAAFERRGWRDASLASAAVGWWLAGTVGVLSHEPLGRASSGADLVPAIQARLTPEMTVYGVKRLDHTLPFYLGRTLVMVENPDELAYGLQREPQRWLPTVAAWRQRWEQGPPALAVMSPSTHAELTAAGVPMTLVARDDRRVAVVNAAPATPVSPK